MHHPRKEETEIAMDGKIKIDMPVIVEGKYDKIKLASILDAEIITTDGFGVFKKKEKLTLIKRLSENGVIVLTDSDGAGKVIRGHLAGAVPPEKIYNLYIPKIEGKEKERSRAQRKALSVLREWMQSFLESYSPILKKSTYLPRKRAKSSRKPISSLLDFREVRVAASAATKQQSASDFPPVLRLPLLCQQLT